MKSIEQSHLQIIYPYESKHAFKNQSPFLAAAANNKTYYLCKGIGITLFDCDADQSTLLMNNAQLPNENHLQIFNNALKKVKGITFEPLFVSENRYLCIGHIDNEQNSLTLTILTIDLNTLGYYEIINIQNVFNLI